MSNLVYNNRGFARARPCNAQKWALCVYHSLKLFVVKIAPAVFNYLFSYVKKVHFVILIRLGG